MESWMRAHRSPSVWRVWAIGCCFAWAVAGADLPVKNIPNFDRVSDYIYRSGQPSQIGLQELGALGIKRVIDLREQGEAAAFEKETLAKLGIKYVNVPFGAFSAPSDEQVQRVLSMLTGIDHSPVLVHCRRGKDRTGTVIACFRIQHDGWDNQRALAEAKEHGMSSLERGMKSYILHFTPITIPGLGLTVH